MAEANLDPVFQIQRVYLKDVSLEQPNSPEILLSQEQPAVDIQLGVGATPVADGLFEVSVTATVQTKIGDKTVFLVEAKQAGIFEVRNVPEDQMGAILGIACPQIVYPYLRGNVADVIQRGGFPPVHMAEINFQAMYEQQQVQAAPPNRPLPRSSFDGPPGSPGCLPANPRMKILVIGAGAWGTAVAVSSADRHQVTLWARDAVLAADLQAARTNARYLPGVPLPAGLRLQGGDVPLAEAIQGQSSSSWQRPCQRRAACCKACSTPAFRWPG
jgi:preprotein translocase subunit SecB